LGSSVNETIELKRLADFTLGHLGGIEGVLSLPNELAGFVDGLENLLILNSSDQDFWRDSHDLKEAYRAHVFMGFQ